MQALHGTHPCGCHLLTAHWHWAATSPASVRRLLGLLASQLSSKLSCTRPEQLPSSPAAPAPPPATATAAAAPCELVVVRPAAPLAGVPPAELAAEGLQSPSARAVCPTGGALPCGPGLPAAPAAACATSPPAAAAAAAAAPSVGVLPAAPCPCSCCPCCCTTSCELPSPTRTQLPSDTSLAAACTPPGRSALPSQLLHLPPRAAAAAGDDPPGAGRTTGAASPPCCRVLLPRAGLTALPCTLTSSAASTAAAAAAAASFLEGVWGGASGRGPGARSSCCALGLGRRNT
jgi:hypothetical protein